MRHVEGGHADRKVVVTIDRISCSFHWPAGFADCSENVDCRHRRSHGAELARAGRIADAQLVDLHVVPEVARDRSPYGGSPWYGDQENGAAPQSCPRGENAS